jgi:hypothetical protein
MCAPVVGRKALCGCLFGSLIHLYELSTYRCVNLRETHIRANTFARVRKCALLASRVFFFLHLNFNIANSVDFTPTCVLHGLELPGLALYVV